MSSGRKINNNKERLRQFKKMANEDWNKVLELSKHSFDINRLQVEYRYLINQLDDFNVYLNTDKQYSELAQLYDDISKKIKSRYDEIYQERANDLRKLLNKNIDMLKIIENSVAYDTLVEIDNEQIISSKNVITEIQANYEAGLDLSRIRDHVSLLFDIFNTLCKVNNGMITQPSYSVIKDDN
ncbi:hypothetical protein HOC87_00965 [Candidatus Bathyarchaeota archaeon]|jgi:hypothetical protein|nr:hypothetical protein [Candidatus Bathyarchaeota archaeon]